MYSHPWDSGQGMVSKSGCIGWLQKRTPMEKTLLSLSILLLLTLFLLILFGIAFHGNKSIAPPEEDDSCWSRECIETAGDILSRMDLGVDSCTNFYGFACGRYGREPEQSVSASRRSIHSVYFALKSIMESQENLKMDGMKGVKSFYNSCLTFGSSKREEKSTQTALINLMRQMGVGTWPLIEPLYETGSFSLERTLASLILLDVPVAFHMDVVPDESISGAYLVKIHPGGPTLKGRDPEEILEDVHLKSSFITSILLLGASSGSTSTYVSDILAVDSIFARIEQNSSKCEVNRLSPRESLSELKRLVPKFDWDVFLSKIKKATGLVRPFAVELHCKHTIRDYITHLSDLPERASMDYLGWRFFSEFVDVIPTSFKFRSGKQEGQHWDELPRWRICLELMERFFSPALAEALTRKMIGQEIQSEVQKISQSILSTTKRLVSGASWLTQQQKSRISEKVAKLKIRYPFQARTDATQLQIPKVQVSNFTFVAVELQRQWVMQNFKKLELQEESSGNADTGMPLTSKGFSSTSNGPSIPLYFDSLQSPYFRLHRPQWMNYGGLGVFLAREISKVLMSFNYDESNAVWNLWLARENGSSCLLKTLRDRLGISEQQWMEEQILNVTKQISLNESASEITYQQLTKEQIQNVTKKIFLDRSASEIAYQSAVSSSPKAQSLPGLQALSQEKMFFLSHAQTLCSALSSSPSSSFNIPARERFNLAVSSFETFNEVFSCSPTSPECRIWA